MALQSDQRTLPEEQDPAPHSTSARRGRVPERTVLLVASFGAVLAFLDATIVNIAFPSIRASFPDESIGDISWVLNAYNIVFAAFMIVFGRLCDLLGRRRIYLLGVGLFTLSSLVCALAPSIEVLIGARITQALGSAMIVPASLALVIDGFPAARKARAVGLWSAAAAVASGLGPPIGGALVEAGGWQWAFWVNLPLGVVAWWLARRQLVDSRAPGRRRMPDLRGAILLAGALGLLNAAIIKADDWGATSPMLWLVIGGTVVLFAGFIFSSMRHRSPVLDAAMMRNRPFVVANIATLVAGVGFFAYMLGNVLWLQYVWQYTILEAGLALVPGALVAAVVAGLLEPVAARFGYRWIISAGFVIWALGYVWYVNAVGTTPDFMGEWLPGQIISGIGVGATLPLLAASTLATQPGGKFATASAVISSARQIGGTIGVALLVVILGTPTAATVVQDLRDGWTMSIIAFAAGAVITLFLGRVSHQSDAVVEVADERPSALRMPDTARSVVLRRAVASPEESLFGRLPSDAQKRLRDGATPRTVRAGEWLLRQGEAAESMFVIVSGRAEVVIDDEVVRELGPGALVGELALFTDGLRSASIRARRDCHVLEVSRDLLGRTIGEDPACLSALVTGLAGQLAQARPTVTRSATRPHLIAVIGVGRGAPTQAIAGMLKRGLAAHARVAQLTGPCTPEQIDRAEAENEMVMLVADGEDRDWTGSCAREADAVVLVGLIGDAPPAALPQTSTRAELVLVGTPARAMRQAWLDAVDPWRVSEISMDEVASAGAPAAGIRGLIDRLSGHSVALVLGGGGARALTHVGVLLELEEAGVRIDRIAGASMGAVLAGYYARGVTAAELGDAAYREFVREDILGDYGLPRTSLARGKRVHRALVRCFDDQRIEEQPRGFRCVSTDLLTRATVMHRSGLMLDAIKASSRLPVLFTPVPSEGRLLVDGGVLDNLPVDSVTERSEGPVIAVNISMSGGGQQRVPGEAPRPVRIPPLGETMLRTLMIGGGGPVEAQQLGAWVITPHSMGVGLLEFHQYDRMVEAGRAAARDLLEQTGGDLQ
ncbi:DHA2 family efflux MFS transporter permease subunit [Microbacterium sp. H1-D42]|uniref:DHA2 family efflux MFS transporter permease subunit n=1 Tax=Microbacterium sp. H1-D42 TaxID=2925844 RepID=UPI001F52BBDC|nr:DHA2 family efflux MFS transporter permease subunit [Microbacterium sp. H1-D42]UNK71485.1 DHA2 family efflux MFS transporter permease subunit [Microbacterium sp. H1-D42]